MEELLKRLSNKGTLIGVVCTIGLLLNQFGIKLDMEWLNVTVNLICTLGITLGVLNNTETEGLDNPFRGAK